MNWWHKNNLRLIQNNLREIDANLDVDLLIRELKTYDANVLMMNAGGIIAFYPTQLEYHYRTPLQKKDLLREAVDKAHQNGMKFIARFDFSKAHESIFQRRPEWFYRTKDGREVNYHGIVHTCLNGYYQREYSLKMIDEVLEGYDVDGIFFNMFGYITFDYSGNEYGNCYCDNCKERFRDMYGLELPESNDVNDPVYQKYKQFQDRTTREMLERIRKLVDSKRKKVAISTYHTHQVDIVRKESNTAINRPHPVWLYSASENVASIENSWDDKLISNCCINAIDLFYRFTGVSRHEVKIRLYESLASGSGLDFCIIGVFDGYPDRENFADVKQIYRFHKKYEHYYGNLQTAADIALIKPENLYSKQQSKEYLGIFKMLKERHVQFDVIMQSRLPAQLPKHEYKAVIIPDITAFNEEELRTLAAAQSKGAILFATGQSLSADGANRRFLSDAFQASVESVEQNVRAAYAYTADKGVFKHFAARDWAIVDGVFALTRFEETVQKPLVYVEPATFGPPERASGHRLSAYAAAGIATHQDGSPRAVYLPWNVGELYYRYGYEDHKHILLDLLDFTLDETYVLKANAPQGVEIFFNRIAGGKYLLQMVNLTGFNGVTYAEPLPVRNIEVSLRSLKADGDVVDLVGQRVSVNSDGHDTVITLEELGDYAAIVIPAGGGQK